MTVQREGSGSQVGPGNRTIATTLLERLAVEGRLAERERAASALGPVGEDLSRAPTWLAEGAVGQMFAAAAVEPALARAIGHRLVAPDAAGLRLYGLGLATPEKAYRRIQSLLPRESASARWSTEEIRGRSAQLCYAPAAGEVGETRVVQAGCALRRGMLEAVPGLFGLLPARVEESSCLARGDATCRYGVVWSATARAGLVWGLGLGVALGLVAALLTQFGVFPDAVGLVLGGAVILLGAALGAVVDGRRQLAAVAGARRGQLALLDQVDETLAHKLDALARADAKLEAEPERFVTRTASGAGSEQAASEREIFSAAGEIFSAAGDLECWLESLPEAETAAGGVSPERGRVREIREWAARIRALVATDEAARKSPVDLVRLVERAIANARPSLARGARVRIEADPELAPLACEPVQIEHVVVQLLANAVEASVELCEAPEVVVSLREVREGVELAVEDRGVGIESHAVDEVFDPFFGVRPGTGGMGLGLTVCLRIVEYHDGELRIENQGRAGTRVTVLLPRAAHGGGS